MKKIYAVFICILVAFTIAGCGNDSQTGSGKTASSGSASKPAQAETQSTGGKALVVCYSATGNTKNVADYIAAWPVNGFIEGNDFTGKKVIPFCTSASSEFGKSGELLKDMAGTGNWLEGKRFHSGASEKDVRDWIADLGL